MATQSTLAPGRWVVALGLLFALASAHADGPSEGDGPDMPAHEMQERVAQVEAEALETDEALAAQRAELAELLEEKMDELGHDTDALVQQVRSEREQVHDSSLPESERRAAAERMQEARDAYRSARRELSQDPDVIEAYEAYDAALRETMEEIDPEIAEIRAELERIQGEMGQMMGQ